MTFFVEPECVDIVFEVGKDVYMAVKVYEQPDDSLYLACIWGDFWNRLKHMRNRQEVLIRLGQYCPLSYNIFAETNDGPGFAYLDKELTLGAVSVEMKAPNRTDYVGTFFRKEVVDKAIDLMKYNRDMFVELRERCPFPQWKKDLGELCVLD